jgi:phosphate uptake regulator
MAEHRREFDQHLDAIDVKVIELFVMVCEDLPTVTQALLSGSTETAGQLAERDRAIDALYREIELLASREILLQAPVASDLRRPGPPRPEGGADAGPAACRRA